MLKERLKLCWERASSTQHPAVFSPSIMFTKKELCAHFVLLVCCHVAILPICMNIWKETNSCSPCSKRACWDSGLHGHNCHAWNNVKLIMCIKKPLRIHLCAFPKDWREHLGTTKCQYDGTNVPWKKATKVLPGGAGASGWVMHLQNQGFQCFRVI